MKNKKIIIILFVVSVILLGGFTFNTFKDIRAEPDCYNVTIKYQTLDASGVPTVHKTISEEYAKGEQIHFVTPEIFGYKPNKTNVSAVVNSDLYLTVNYSCLHSGEFDESLDEVVTYPTADTVGIIKHYCDTCDGYYQEEFTSLTRTVTFGGEELNNLTRVGEFYNGYSLQNGGGILILEKEYLPELDIIFNGIIDFDGNVGLRDAATVTFSYDKVAWDNADIVYKANPNYPVVDGVDFSFRFGNSWRLIFGYEGRDGGSLPDFIFSDDCPLITDPLTITLTYDYTYTD